MRERASERERERERDRHRERKKNRQREEEKEKEKGGGGKVNLGPFLNWNHEVKRRRKPSYVYRYTYIENRHNI